LAVYAHVVGQQDKMAADVIGEAMRTIEKTRI